MHYVLYELTLFNIYWIKFLCYTKGNYLDVVGFKLLGQTRLG